MTYSYWQHTIGLDTPSAEIPRHEEQYRTEVCIIGGGITGACAAYLLQRAGIATILVEARRPALGATGRNAGMVNAGVGDNYANAVERYGRKRARALWEFTMGNREATLRLAAKLGVPHRRCGNWQLAHTAEEAEAFALSAKLMKEDELPHEYYDHDPLGRGFHAALLYKENGAMNPAKFVHALIRASKTTLLTHAPVTRLEVSPSGRRTAVVTAGADGTETVISCKNVFLATNAYSGLIHPFFADKIQPNRGQIQVSAPAPMLFDRCAGSHFGFYYFQQVPDPEDPSMGRWLMGGGRHSSFETENGLISEQTNTAVQDNLRQFTASHFPELVDLPIERRWAGTMGFTADKLPLIGQLEDMPRVTYCVGFSGDGMAFALRSVETALMQMLDVL